MPSAFISRALSPASPFRLRLEAAGWRVHGMPLIELTALPAVAELPACDWIFFSSRHAVDFFFDAYAAPAAIRWAAIGPGTAAALERRIGRIDFSGAGEPVAAAAAFLRVAAGQRVLFPGAAQSRQSIQRQLGERIAGHSLAVYDNRPLADPPARPDDDVLVFTSPMNARAYFERHTLGAGQRTVAIGQPTAEALRRYGISTVAVAETPSEDDLARAVLGLRG